MNAKVTTTSVEVAGNEILGTKAKKLYYLIIETSKGKYNLNVGEKTHEEVKKLTDVVTKIEGVGGDPKK